MLVGTQQNGSYGCISENRKRSELFRMKPFDNFHLTSLRAQAWLVSNLGKIHNSLFLGIDPPVARVSFLLWAICWSVPSKSYNKLFIIHLIRYIQKLAAREVNIRYLEVFLKQSPRTGKPISIRHSDAKRHHTGKKLASEPNHETPTEPASGFEPIWLMDQDLQLKSVNHLLPHGLFWVFSRTRRNRIETMVPSYFHVHFFLPRQVGPHAPKPIGGFYLAVNL